MGGLSSLAIIAPAVSAWHHRKQVLVALSILRMMRIASDKQADLSGMAGSWRHRSRPPPALPAL